MKYCIVPQILDEEALNNPKKIKLFVAVFIKKLYLKHRHAKPLKGNYKVYIKISKLVP